MISDRNALPTGVAGSSRRAGRRVRNFSGRLGKFQRERWRVVQEKDEINVPPQAGKLLASVDVKGIEANMTTIDTAEETELLRRVRSEFDELPRMRLTCAQVARLLTADGMACEHTLQTLLRSGYLGKQGSVYFRADECYV